MKPLTILAFTLLATACDRSDDSARKAEKLPQRQSDALLILGTVDELGLTDDGRRLTIDLALPESLGNWAPTACGAMLPAEFVIGQVRCAAVSVALDPNAVAPLTAGQARQLCSGSADFGVIEPSQGISFPGYTLEDVAACNGVEYSVYRFAPEVAITLAP